MEASPAVVANAKKSMVIVSSTRDERTYYCGFIVAQSRVYKGKPCTMIIAPNPFVLEAKHRVCFFDGEQLPATVVDEDRHFCLLATAVHRGCLEFTPSDVDIICSPTFMLAPVTPTQSISVSTHIPLHSLQSYALDDVEREIQDSQNYFVMSCGEYNQTTPDGTDRLSGGLVYNLSGRALGAVLQDCRIMEENHRGMKVVVGPVYLKQLLGRLLPEVPTIARAPPDKGGRKKMSKRKRGSSSSVTKGARKAARSV